MITGPFMILSVWIQRDDSEIDKKMPWNFISDKNNIEGGKFISHAGRHFSMQSQACNFFTCVQSFSYKNHLSVIFFLNRKNKTFWGVETKVPRYVQLDSIIENNLIIFQRAKSLVEYCVHLSIFEFLNNCNTKLCIGWLLFFCM